MSSRVERVQNLRRSGAAGPHRSRRVEDEIEEPCTCGTGFTCLAEIHEDDEES